MALLIACVGIYGLLTFMIAHGQREIGIRIALGAGLKHLAQLIGSQVVAMVGIGAVLGVSIALAANKWLTSLVMKLRLPIRYP